MSFELPSPGPILGGIRVRSELNKVFISIRIQKENTGNPPHGYEEFLSFLEGSLEMLRGTFPEETKPKKGTRK